MSAFRSTSPLPPLLTIFLLAAITGCGGGVTIGDPEPPLRGDMSSHFDQAAQIRHAIVRGDLDAVDRPAGWLAGHERPAAMPASADPYLRDMRHLAERARDATELVVAAEALSRMGRTCASCHGAHDGGPSFGPVEMPASPTMVRHAWAVDRMWEGLIGPAEARWAAGIDALATGIDLQPGAGPDSRELARKAAEMASSAREARDWGTRTELYGRLLSTCAACHAAEGVTLR